MPRKCCICFEIYNRKNKRSFYIFPNFTVCSQKSSRERLLIERRRNLWMQVTERNLDTFSGTLSVCSDHFVSGKPAYLHLTEDVDWVPTLNLGHLGKDNQSLSTNSGGSSIDNNGSLQTECGKQQGLINTNTNHIPRQDRERNDENQCDRNCEIERFSTKCGSDIQAITVASNATSEASKKATDCLLLATRPKAMVTIVNRELLHDDCPAENSSIGVQYALDQGIIVKEERMDVVETRPKPMVTIFNRELLHDGYPAGNSSAHVQCALDQGTTIKEERIDIEEAFEAQFNKEGTAYPFQSISTAECGTQVEFDKPCCPLQLDKSTQTRMSSFPKPPKFKKRQ